MNMSSKTTNKILSLFALLLVLLLGYYFMATKSTTSSGSKNDVALSLDYHVRGATNGKVTLIEFGDFQCPACGGYEPLVRQVVAANAQDVRIVFRNFPLTQLHPNALLAAKYAEAAALQGKFWEMHDALYDNQKEWSGALNAKDYFEKYGAALGLDIKKLAADALRSDIESKILAQYKEGVRLGVQGTPTFFVNGQMIDNPPSVEAFSKILMDAKAKVQ
jgi:protein-disulfide isomerase